MSRPVTLFTGQWTDLPFEEICRKAASWGYAGLEIAFDLHTTQKLFEVFDRRPALGINFDPSHLLWQGLEPHLFIREFADRIYHVHMKDCAVTLDGKAGLELPLAGPRRRRFRGDHPRAERGRIRRPALRRMGGQQHGPGTRRPGSPGVCPRHEFHPGGRVLRPGHENLTSRRGKLYGLRRIPQEQALPWKT